MKSERRHELKTNSLAKAASDFPAFLQQHGSRFLLTIVLGLLVYILAYRWFSGRSEKVTRAGNDLSTALYALDHLRNPQASSPAGLANWRKEFAGEVEAAVSDLLSITKDPQMQAEALVARGDVNWLLANYPPLPGSATNEALRVDRSTEDLLAAAESAYTKVLHLGKNTDLLATLNARFNLACIAENRRQWDKAREQYQQVLDSSATPAEFKKLAQSRLEALKELQKPVYLAGPAKPATQNALGSAMDLDLSPRSLEPATTRPSAGRPSTRPSASVSAAPTTSATSRSSVTK
ncbi:MAG TPA: hypothetical protein VFC78_13710 [Tepidisphaeraceae bacterium]|nr:hypothetical protein [Tepidisphaeraceae bacterium]